MTQGNGKRQAVAVDELGYGLRYGAGVRGLRTQCDYLPEFYARSNRVAQSKVEAVGVEVEAGNPKASIGQRSRSEALRVDTQAQRKTAFEDHFEKWCDTVGLTTDMVDRDGRKRDTSRIWYEQYCAAPDGIALQTWDGSVTAWLYKAFLELSDGLSLSG